jgi:hypothetical protein
MNSVEREIGLSIIPCEPTTVRQYASQKAVQAR